LEGPVAQALIVATRFGLLVGLTMWTGLALATLALAPVVYTKLERAQADDVAGALFARVDRLLLVALGLLLVSLAVQAVVEKSSPPGRLLLPLAGMAGSLLVAAFAVSPALRALRDRMRDANAPASEAERSAYGRLHSAWLVLLTLEVCLGLYALFVAS
jgi:hypothetical protein